MPSLLHSTLNFFEVSLSLHMIVYDLCTYVCVYLNICGFYFLYSISVVFISD